MSALRKNVTSQNLSFSLISATTGAALTGATVTVKRNIDGTQATAAGSVTELGSGQYNFSPSQADTNGNMCSYLFTATNAIPRELTCFTIGYDPTLANIPANLTQVNAHNVTDTTSGIPDVNAKNINNATAPTITGDAYARLGAPAGASVSTDIAAVKTDTAAVKVQTDKLAFTVANQVDCNVIDWKGSAAPAMTGDAFARIGAAGAGLAALGDTRIANLDAAISTRSTYTGVDTAGTTTLLSRIPTYPANFSALAITAGGAVTAGTVSDKTGYTVSTVSDKTGYSLTQTFPANFSSLGIGAAGHITNVDTLTTYTGNTPQTGDGYARIGAAGAGLTSIGDTRISNLDAAVSSRSTLAAGAAMALTTGERTATAAAIEAAIINDTDGNAVLTAITNKIASVNPSLGGLTLAAIASQVRTELSIELGRIDASISSRLDTSGYSAPPSAATIAGQVWDLALSGHTATGSTGAALNAAGSAGDPWSTMLPGSYGAGTAGYIVGHNIDATISSRSTFSGGAVASVTADVGITQAAADKVWGTGARTLTGYGTLASDAATAVWSATTRTLSSGANIALAKGVGVTGFNDIAATDVWAETTRTLSSGANIVLAKGTGITGLNDIAAGAAMTLTGVYDAAKNAASQTSVNAIPTTPMLAASYTAPDNTSIAAIKAKTDNLPSDPADESLVIAATNSLASAIADLPTNSELATALGGVTATVDTGAVADAVWDSALTDHTTAGTAGKALSSAGASGDPWSTQLPGSYPAGTAGHIVGNSGAGSGSIEWAYTVADERSGNPIADVELWVSTDLSGRNVIAYGRSNQYGTAKFYLDSGTVYVFRRKAGVDFVNPDVETVS